MSQGIEIGVDEGVKRALVGLKGHRNGYEGFSKGIEARFLRTGKVMESFLVNNMNLTSNCDKIYHLAIGNDGSTSISDSMNVVMSLLEYVEGYSNDIQGLIEKLDSCHEILEPILEYEARLMRVFKPLKFARALFLLESASLQDDRKEIFIALAHEIDEMYKQVNDLSLNEFHKFGDVNESIQEISVKLKKDTEQERNVIDFQKDHIESSLSKLKEDLECNKNITVSLTDVTKKISSDVEAIIMIIQNEDITRQKLEHVVEGTDEVLKRAETWLNNGADVDDKETLAFLACKSKIQIGVIQSVFTDFKNTQITIQEKSKSLGDKVKQLDRESLALSEFKVLTTSANGIIESLIVAIEKATAMVKSGNARARNVHEVVQPFKGISSNITVILRKLSDKLRLVVLNAQLKAAQIGRGTGLQVLSANISAISDEAQSISNKVGGELEKIALALSEIVESFDVMCKKSSEKEVECSKSSAQSEQSLHEFRDNTLGLVLDLGDQADEIMSIANNLDHDFSSDFSACDYLEEFIAHFNEFVRIGEKACGENIHDYLSQEEIGNANYTMQEEWDIQQRVMGENGTPHVEKKEESDAVDGLELF